MIAGYLRTRSGCRASVSSVRGIAFILKVAKGGVGGAGRGERDFLGRTRSPGAAVLANLVGLRAKGVTTAELANFKAQQYEKMFDALDAEALQIATRFQRDPDEANRRLAIVMQRMQEVALEAKALFSVIPKDYSRPRPPAPVRRAIGVR